MPCPLGFSVGKLFLVLTLTIVHYVCGRPDFIMTSIFDMSRRVSTHINCTHINCFFNGKIYRNPCICFFCYSNYKVSIFKLLLCEVVKTSHFLNEKGGQSGICSMSCSGKVGQHEFQEWQIFTPYTQHQSVTMYLPCNGKMKLIKSEIKEKISDALAVFNREERNTLLESGLFVIPVA